MGNSPGKLTEDETNQLMKDTNFDRDEIMRLYKLAMKNGRGSSEQLSQSQCTALLHSLGARSDFLAQLLFGVLDKNGDGLVDFRELLLTLSIASHGNSDDKIELMFKIYDINDNGLIEKNELLKIFTALFKVRNEVKQMKGLPLGMYKLCWAMSACSRPSHHSTTIHLFY
eukprot:TRINITY_DN31539_c0_g1_i1.p1 TRINITY_DN31539_c0_g1~~TRINITY_DN31539_c0_g1_i1.p1  ORF type:complete len:170 (-),score=21.47 TRINITY_DN31539_c0_g1_i1:13-522(-)